ncbi:MAG: PASTA domain-containing protein [Arenicellales bacterium]
MKSLKSVVGLTVGDLKPRFGNPRPSGTTGAGKTNTGGAAGAAGAGAQSGGAGGSSGSGVGGASAGPGGPSSPEMASRIFEWITAAEPPENVTMGANLHYTLRGNKVGTVPGGVITSPHETGRFDPVYLWTNRRTLDSVNLCTMEEYVRARLAHHDISGCRGRYKPLPTIPDLAGNTLKEAKAKLAGLGVRPVVRPGTPAPSDKLSGTVESVQPAPGTRVKPGTDVVLVIHSPHVNTATIPDLRGSSLKQAMAALEKLGLAARIRPGPPAPSANLSGKVAEQTPVGGTTVEKGTRVVLAVYSPHVNTATIPDLRGSSLTQAKAALEKLGLAARIRPGPPAPSANLSGKVASQTPAQGTTVEKGARVVVAVYSPHVNTATIPDLRGSSLRQAKAALEKLGLTPAIRPGPQAPSADLSGKVASQTPAQGATVEKGTRVVLAVYSPHVNTATIPDLRGSSLTQAKAVLEKLGLAARIRPGPPAPSADLSGKIADQTPAEGTMVGKGTPVELVVYAPHANLRTVPDLVGKALSQAKASLRQLGLVAQVRLGTPASSAAQAGTVASQEPAGGVRVKAGTNIRIAVYGNFVMTTTVPSIKGLDAPQAETVLRGAGLTPVRRNAGNPPSAGQSNKVVEQSPAAGATVKIGSSVAFAAYGTYKPVVQPPQPSNPPDQRVAYDNPMVSRGGTYPLDNCYSWTGQPGSSKGCGKPAADAWCRAMGYREATANFVVAPQKPPTLPIGGGPVCTDWYCGPITHLECVRAGSPAQRPASNTGNNGTSGSGSTAGARPSQQTRFTYELTREGCPRQIIVRYENSARLLDLSFPRNADYQYMKHEFCVYQGPPHISIEMTAFRVETCRSNGRVERQIGPHPEDPGSWKYGANYYSPRRDTVRVSAYGEVYVEDVERLLPLVADTYGRTVGAKLCRSN